MSALGDLFLTGSILGSYEPGATNDDVAESLYIFRDDLTVLPCYLREELFKLYLPDLLIE
jgi:hypothetical protein